jgi:hypothetical protein
MRNLRLRFREFLLLITLASLIAAALAMRARTAYERSTPPHPAVLALQVRRSPLTADRPFAILDLTS